jgi:hypothetical protein
LYFEREVDQTERPTLTAEKSAKVARIAATVRRPVEANGRNAFWRRTIT